MPTNNPRHIIGQFVFPRRTFMRTKDIRTLLYCASSKILYLPKIYKIRHSLPSRGRGRACSTRNVWRVPPSLGPAAFEKCLRLCLYVRLAHWSCSGDSWRLLIKLPVVRDTSAGSKIPSVKIRVSIVRCLFDRLLTEKTQTTTRTRIKWPNE